MKMLPQVTLAVALLLLPMLDAQLPFSQVPSPPRVFFGGFRPFFPNRSRRPPRRPPSFAFNRPTRQQDFLSAPPTFRPPPPLPTQGNFRAPINTHRPRQQQHVPSPNFNGFGAPKPQSIIGPTNNHLTGPPVRQSFGQTQPRRPASFNNNNQFVRQPVSFLSDNSIIGMVPPPPLFSSPPSPQQQVHQPPPQQVHQQQHQQQPPQAVPHRPPPTTLRSQVHHAQPVFEQFQTPTGSEIDTNFPIEELQFNTSPRRPSTSQAPASKPVDPSDLQFNPFDILNSNSIDDLVVNKVPPVNAGVLPLAHEKPSQLELFPPFTRRG